MAATADAAPKLLGSLGAHADIQERVKDNPKEKKEEVVNTFVAGHQIRAEYVCTPGYERIADCFCVRFSPDCEHLAACFANGAIHVYNARTGGEDVVLNRPGPNASVNPTTQLRWGSAADGILASVSAAFDGHVTHWDVKSGKCLHTITEPNNPLFCLDYFSDGSNFATAGKERCVRVYDAETQRNTCTLTGCPLERNIGHSNRVFSLKYHPNNQNILLSGSWDNTVLVWDAREGSAIKSRSIWGCFISGDAVDFSADGTRILTGSWRLADALQVHDFGTSALMETIAWPEKSSCMLYAAQFSKDPQASMILAGGSNENEARFLAKDSNRKSKFFGIVRTPKPVFSVDFSPDSSRAAIGCADGQVRVYNVV